MHLIQEKQLIEVIAIFKQDGPKPYAIKWGGKKYIVEKINLRYEKKTGDGKLVYFSVTSEDNYFKLVFDTNNLKWYLEEAYHE